MPSKVQSKETTAVAMNGKDARKHLKSAEQYTLHRSVPVAGQEIAPMLRRRISFSSLAPEQRAVAERRPGFFNFSSFLKDSHFPGRFISRSH